MESARTCEDFQESTLSQRAFAKKQGIARTTLQHQLKRIDADDPQKVFFESVAGQKWLHQMMTALVFTFEIHHNSGLRQLEQFLKQSGLAVFVSASKSSLAKYAAEMEKLIITFGAQEEEKLAKIEPDKELTIMVDETFPANEICLVTMHAESGYLLAEKLSDDRSYESWKNCLDETKERLGIKSFTQIVSDEAKALLKLAKEEKAQHNTDLFHVLLNISRAISGRLEIQQRSTQKLVDKAFEHVEKREHALKSGSSPLQNKARLDIASEQLKEAEALHQVNLDTSIRYKKARNSISKSFHPYDIETGQLITPEDLDKSLNESFSIIKEIAAPYGEKALEKISKSEKLVPVLLDMMTYYHQQTELVLEQETYSKPQLQLLRTTLMPALYILAVSKKKRPPSERRRLEDLSHTLLVQIWGEDPLYDPTSSTQEEINRMIKTATKAIAVFQRSSSPVEGRNSQLNLQQHCRHKLSERKLSALTVLHNFFIKQKDGTTAARRFFGVAHVDLFTFLQENMSHIGRPRKRKALLLVS